MAPHPDLEAEQAFIDHAYDRLDAMRSAATAMLRGAFEQAGTGTPQSLTERDVSVRTSLARLQHLEIGDEPLIFGRIDTQPGPDGTNGDRASQSFHIGRLAVSDDDQEALVVDWRAPIAEPFYRATGRHPMGLARRRHLLSEGRQVVDLEDELFGGDGPDGGLGIGGSTALLAALERSRTGRMRDIVATVQREQDEIIRAPLPGILVVQGGPGTGKTAVALHRAAYLLYTFRFPLERQGVLVVGPNPLFLRYIEHVLPSLGESGVELSTISGLVPDVRAGGIDTPLAARVKGDPRMARVVAKAVADRQRPLTRDVEIGYGPFVLRLSVEDSAEVVVAAKRRHGPHNSRRRLVETLVARRLAARLGEAEARARRVGLRPVPAAEDDDDADDLGDDLVPSVGAVPDPGDDRAVAELARELRRLPDVAEALDRMWPVLTPEQLLHDLYGARPLIELATARRLRDDEAAALYRPRSPGLADVAWTDADVALLDEARNVLGPVGRRRRPGEGTEGEADEVRTYGHVVVDEAQDLTPMQLRMLGRRSLSGSMTVVGDVAQATGPFAAPQWSDVLAHLPTPRGVRQVELTVNYRTPAEIMALAGRVLEMAAPHVRLPESVRDTGHQPARVPVGPGGDGSGRARAVVDVTRAELAAAEGGTVAVIAPPSLVDGLADALEEAGIDATRGGRRGLDAPVTLLPVEVVKGLEFDRVVVVEPAYILREAAQGLNSLFVALTRATQQLTLVHAEPLPGMLEDVPA